MARPGLRWKRMRQAAAVLIHFRPIVLTAAERHRLKKAACGHKP